MSRSIKRATFLLLAVLGLGYLVTREPVTTTLVTDHGHFILAQAAFRSSCMRVVESLERKEALTVSDPWGVEHLIVAVSCERGNDTIGRAVLEGAAIEQ